MKRTLIAMVALGALLAGCSANDGTEAPSVDTQKHELAPDAKPFYEFEAGGHLFQFVQPGGAGLVLVEKTAVGETSLLAGYSAERPSVTAMYQYLKPGAKVPQELLDFDAKVKLVASPSAALPDPEVPPPQGSPQLAPASEPGQHTAHEAGAAHFQSSHCPTQPDPGTSFDYYEEHSPQSTRLFCWSGGYTGTWTESSTAKVLTHTVAAVFRSVRYEMSVQGWSGGWDVLQGQQYLFNGWNGTFWDCWCVPICACGDEDYNIKGMSGKVFDGTQGPSTWRFGGGFWK